MSSETAVERAADTVSVTIDGFQISVPKGTLVIRAAETLGIQIPRFCEHPLLDPIGACRQCLVEIEGQRKPQASCTIACTDSMVVRTQLTSAVADKAQHGQMEFLLINHPLDCPMCDKGGECPLQNQAMSNGRGETRFGLSKRTFPKPVPLSTQVLLDRERCIQCTRCTRFSEQIAGDPLIDLFERGAQEQIGVAEGQPFDSYFSGNTVQICPVGALTGAAYRFRSRPYDLVSTPSVCEHCAAGCRQRTDHRRGRVMRRLAGDDPQVNEEWNCDKGRWAFAYAAQPDRLATPLVRNSAGVLEPASWPEAVAAAAGALSAARGRAGVLAGGRLTLEDAYGYAKFARVALRSNDIDMRARPHSAEEAQFLAAQVAGRGIQVTYRDLERAPAVLLAGFEPEDESPIVFLRLRKAVREHGLRVLSLAPMETRGLRKMSGKLIMAAPGAESAVLGAMITGDPQEPAELLKREGSVILAGERLAAVPGALSAVVRLARATGARLAWIPRRAGERGAVEAGAMPNLLPAGRPAGDPEARAEVARAWGTATLPDAPGRDTGEILAAAAAGKLDALVVAGVDPDDLPDPAAARAALESAGFVVSLELRASAVTDRADVVFPVAPVAEKAGTFLNWEGRGGTFGRALEVPGSAPDLEVLGAIADEMDVHLGLPGAAAARRELAALGTWTGAREVGPHVPAMAGQERPEPSRGEVLLTSWHHLLDAGRMQDGEPYLAGTARPAAAVVSRATADALGLTEGDKVTVAHGGAGQVTVPVEVSGGAMADGVVWLPANSAGCSVRRDLGAGAGTIVRVSKG